MPRGECNCGAVAFEINADLSAVFVCHCSICRKLTGSGGIAVTLDRAGQHSIRINEQWRVCFRWTDAGPEQVEIVDYH